MRTGKPVDGGEQQRTGSDRPSACQLNEGNESNCRPDQHGARHGEVCRALEHQRLPALAATRRKLPARIAKIPSPAI
jgi:hypothetical protein